jgi:hypothetical protein
MYAEHKLKQASSRKQDLDFHFYHEKMLSAAKHDILLYRRFLDEQHDQAIQKRRYVEQQWKLIFTMTIGLKKVREFAKVDDPTLNRADHGLGSSLAILQSQTCQIGFGDDL